MTRARILADYVSGGTTSAEFDYLDGVTSNIQTQLNAKQATVTTGIANANHLVANANVADDDFLKVDGTSIEGRTVAETKTDLSLSNVENTALSTWAGSSNITSIGAATASSFDCGTTCFSDSYEANYTTKGQTNCANSTWTTIIGLSTYAPGVYQANATVNGNFSAYGATMIVNVGHGNDWGTAIKYPTAAIAASNTGFRVSGSEIQYIQYAGSTQAVMWKITKLMETNGSVTGTT